MKFDFYPMPAWPAGAATIMDGNYWMMNAATREPEATWELLRFVALDPQWQQAMMKVVLLPPALSDLATQYLDFMKVLIPPLKHKNLSPYSDPLVRGEVYPNPLWPYSNTQAYALYSQSVTEILAKKVSIPLGYRQATQRIDALEAQRTSGVQEGQRLRRQFRRLPRLFGA